MRFKIFFCSECGKSSLMKEDIYNHGCHEKYILEGITIIIKSTLCRRFVDWFFSKDISLGLAILGMVGLNGMLMQHFQLTIGWSVVEGLCFGLAIPRLLK